MARSYKTADSVGAGHARDRTLGPAQTLPKAEQRRAGIRTLQVGALAQALEPAGKVVVDPRHRLLLAAPENGVIAAPAGGFATSGSRIKKGQVLAYLFPAIPLPERRGLEADLALTERDLRDSKLNAERFNANEAEGIEISLPTPSIQILSEYKSAQTREQALGQALRDRVTLTAGASGVLIRSAGRRDAVVKQGETLFEWGEAGRFLVSTRLLDAGQSADSFREAVTGDGRRFDLSLLAENIDPKTGTREARFAIDPASAAAGHLIEGETVRLRATNPPAHVALPVAALHGGDGQRWVWTHPTAEQFLAHAVEVQIEGDGTVRVSGLSGDERVVIAGAQELRLPLAGSQ